MNEKRCPKCGSYITVRPFYSIPRKGLGLLHVYMCVRCGETIQEWEEE